MKNFFLFGGAVWGKCVLEAALLSGWTCQGIFDDNPDLQNQTLLGKYTVAGTRERLRQMRDESGINTLFVAVGTNFAREKLVRFFEDDGFTGVSIIHPAAVVSPSAVIEPWTIVRAGTVVDCDVRIGKGSIINTMAMIGHDTEVGSFCHIAANVAVGSELTIADGVLVGMGSTILSGVSLGSGVTVGVGTVVMKEIHKAGTWLGVPAKRVW